MAGIIMGYIIFFFLFVFIRTIKSGSSATNNRDKIKDLKILDENKLKKEELLNSNKMFQTDSNFEDLFGKNNNPIKEKSIRRKGI